MEVMISTTAQRYWVFFVALMGFALCHRGRTARSTASDGEDDVANYLQYVL
jgi:hypothetical protein